LTTNEKQCVLAGVCKNAGNQAHCNSRCQAFVSLHAASGNGGRVAAANIPNDYRLVTVKNMPTRDLTVKIDGKTPTLANVLDSYVDSFKRQFEASGERIKSLYLWSRSPGTGKTTTAASLANTYLIKHYIGSLAHDRQVLQRPVLFVDVNQLQTDYNQFNRPRVPDSVAEPAAQRYYKTIEQAKVTPFAILDDVGVRENVTDGFRGDLHSIINARVTNQLATVYTSNIPISELPMVFGEARLADRIKDMTMEIEFTGGSKRGMRNK
jgi:DNA replication protein DnaC